MYDKALAFPESGTIHAWRFFAGTGIDPKVVPAERSGLPPGIHPVHYATSVFGGVGADAGVDGHYRIWQAKRHARRIVSNAEKMGIIREGDLDPSGILEWMLQLGRMNLLNVRPNRPFYLRPAVFATDSDLGVAHKRSYGVEIISRERTQYLKLGEGGGVRVWHPGHRVCRPNELCGEPGVKSATNYGSVARWKIKGTELYGAPETLLETLTGFLSETTGSNIFLVVNDELYTPNEQSDILSGITRAFVIRAARALGITVHADGFIQPRRLRDAEEVFLTGTWAGITPVTEIVQGFTDPEPIVAPFVGRVGEITRRISEIYRAAIKHDFETLAQIAPGLDVTEDDYAEFYTEFLV